MSGAARTIARNTGVQAVADVLGKLASLAFYAVMARELGQAGFGAFTFALSLALVLTVFAGFGTDQLITRSVAQDRSTAPRLLTDALAVKVGLGLLGLLAAVAFAAVAGYSEAVVAAVALLSGAAIVELSSKSYYATFQGFDDMRPPAASLLLQRVATAAAGVAAMVAGAGVVGVSLVYLGGALLALAYVALRLRRVDVRPGGGVSARRATELVRASAALGVSVILSTALFRIDAVLLSLIKGNAATGLYGVAYRLLESTLFISYTFVAALLPTLSRLTPQSTPSIGDAFEVGAKLIATALLPLGTVFALFPEPIIRILYGPDFGEAASAVRLLGFAAAFYGLTYLSSYVLISQGRQRVLPWIVGGVLLLNVGLNLVVIPVWSYDGAAAVTSISEVALSVAYVVCVLRITGPVSLPRIVTGPLVACAALGGVALVVGTGLAGLLVAAVVYPVVLLAVERLVFPADVRLLRGVLRRESPVSAG
jgi:O-antigen/teichoic acid export membrane protein